MLWFLIAVAIGSGVVSIIETSFIPDVNESTADNPWNTSKVVLFWVAPCVMVLSIVGAVTFYHVQWATRTAAETVMMNGRFGQQNVVDVLDQGASATYQGWRDVLVVLRGTPYDRTLKLRVDPTNGGVMKW